MASVFSYVASFRSFSDRDAPLTHSPRAGHSFHFPHHILDSSLTVEPICLRRATIVNPLQQRTSPLYGTAANDADVSTKKARRFLWHPPASGNREFSFWCSG